MKTSEKPIIPEFQNDSFFANLETLDQTYLYLSDKGPGKYFNRSKVFALLNDL